MKKLPKEFKQAEAIHKLYHAFLKKFQKREKILNPKKHWVKIGRKTIKHSTKESWRWIGYPLMQRIEKWAKDHKTVTITRCDDNHHCGSYLVMIPHENKKSYMGTTMLYVPQCTGEQPIQIFLYPNHTKGLMKALDVYKKRANKKGSLS